ncbi:MAG: M48 family metallopeptidase [Clostridiales bacterium]|nr:M48 family metallopeptidase [Clostridiales bacterium]
MMNPTNEISVSFSEYLRERSTRLDKHLSGGIPDYAFAADYATRQKIAAIPGVFKLGKALTSQIVPRQRQLLNMQALRVGPNQFPEIYKMVTECASLLGIGVPSVFVMPEVATINAYAYATEDAEPVIVLNSALVERLTPREIKAVIGHECGHIHNNHGIYNILAELIINGIGLLIPGAREILAAISLPLRTAILTWGRAAEITCDRAGIICCGEAESTISTHAKFVSGGLLSGQETNIEALLEQYDTLRTSPVRLLELISTHPAGVRRILAAKEFMNSQVYYDWHPEQKTGGAVYYSKQELDSRCAKYVSVTKNQER